MTNVADNAPPRVVVPWTSYTPAASLMIFHYYLVESCLGELLVVTNDLGCIENHPQFTVHRVDVEAGELVHVNDLGDHMLFVGEGCSWSVLRRS